MRETSETLKDSSENILGNNDFEKADDEINEDYEEKEQ